MPKRYVSGKNLREIIRRIVDTADPERIILFGSAARGSMDLQSDIDLLVIKSGSYNPREIAGRIYQNLYGIGKAFDIIVVTPEQVEQYCNSPYLVIYPALKEGKVIYERRPVTAG
jgi:predicted nucleotidyltransferase